MPTYEYACTACDHTLEAVQSFSDAALTVCPECGGALRKVFSAVGVVFKGSGFYKTDSRSSSNGGESKQSESSSEPKAPAKSESKSESKAESKSESKSESKAASKKESKKESKPATSTPAAS